MVVGNDNTETAVDAFDHPVLQITTDRPERRLMLVLLSQLEDIDADLQTIVENHHVGTASGGALDRMGQLTNTSRRDGEGDDYYRYRLIAEGATKRIQPTFEEVAPLTRLLLDADYDDIDFTTDLDANPRTFEVTAPASVWDSAPLDRTDLDAYLDAALPPGASFNRVEN